MITGRQTFSNEQDAPIYISIEPTPDCFELEPGETLTLIYEVPEAGDALLVNFISETELVIWPMGTEEPEVLINNSSAEGRSWKFKHLQPPL
jgi:hypothetical protein